MELNMETLNVDLYQFNAMKYRLESADATYALLNLGAEAGEVLGVAAKYQRDGSDYSTFVDNMSKELGDVMWMVAAVASDFGLRLSDICVQNLTKLEDRQKRNAIKGSGDSR
jgi:NTP pyrophosphatase (non-canonical NTP hydrolase)